VTRSTTRTEQPEEQGGDTLSDRSGWPPHASERRDFCNRLRAIPPEVASWRRRFLDRLANGDPRFPAVRGLAVADIQSRLEDGITSLRELARILAVLYGTPDLGNKADPTDELVYIILARKTREEAYRKSFDQLKSRFATWDELLDAPRKKVERLVWSGGQANRVSRSL
jgi:hypothetical protein